MWKYYYISYSKKKLSGDKKEKIYVLFFKSSHMPRKAQLFVQYFNGKFQDHVYFSVKP